MKLQHLFEIAQRAKTLIDVIGTVFPELERIILDALDASPYITSEDGHELSRVIVDPAGAGYKIMVSLDKGHDRHFVSVILLKLIRAFFSRRIDVDVQLAGNDADVSDGYEYLTFFVKPAS